MSKGQGVHSILDTLAYCFDLSLLLQKPASLQSISSELIDIQQITELKKKKKRPLRLCNNGKVRAGAATSQEQWDSGVAKGSSAFLAPLGRFPCLRGGFGSGASFGSPVLGRTWRVVAPSQLRAERTSCKWGAGTSAAPEQSPAFQGVDSHLSVD